jgi:hypothetical protein
VIFYRADQGNMLTRTTLDQVKSAEDQLFSLPGYSSFCLQKVNPVTSAIECRRPVSVTNIMYGSLTSQGFVADGDSTRQLDPVRSAQV